MRRLELADKEDKVKTVTFDQVPSIALQLVIDVFGQAHRTIEMHGLFTPHEQTKQMVESNEMIDMRVGDVNLVDALYLPWGK